MDELRKLVEVRFWKYVNKTDACWLWTAGKTEGYGRFWVTRRGGVFAHRFAYELIVGPIPAGLTLDHLCRVRSCVNPAHLEPVSNRENILRGEGPTAVRARQTQCIHGHKFDPANTKIVKTGYRLCRECHRECQRRFRRRVKQIVRDAASQATPSAHE